PGPSASEVERVTHEAALVLQHDLEMGDLAREYGRHAPGADVQVHEVAEGMQDRDDTQSRQQEGEHVAERKVVVDGADQHQDERNPEAQAVASGKDVDAA